MTWHERRSLESWIYVLAWQRSSSRYLAGLMTRMGRLWDDITKHYPSFQTQSKLHYVSDLLCGRDYDWRTSSMNCNLSARTSSVIENISVASWGGCGGCMLKEQTEKTEYNYSIRWKTDDKGIQPRETRLSNLNFVPTKQREPFHQAINFQLRAPFSELVRDRVRQGT